MSNSNCDEVSTFSGRMFLVGMMGAGKTTVGRRLAKDLKCKFIDLDRELEKRNGVPVATIFEIEGESGFRARETQILIEVSGRPDFGIIATGGGIVLDPLNRLLLQCNGMVVYLHASPNLLYSRTRLDKSRPLLQVADPLSRITKLVEQRDPLYREIADIVIEAGQDISVLTDKIKTACRIHE